MKEYPMLRVVLVDDEKPSRDEIKYLLEEIPNVEVCGEAGSGEESLEIIAQTRPDVVFLDIKMYDMDGLEVAEKLLQESNPPLIIFATAYREHAVKAFEINALDYILKPFSEKRVMKAVSRVQAIYQEQEKEAFLGRIADLVKSSEENKNITKFPVEKNGRIYPLELSEICFFYVENKETRVVTRSEEFYINHTIQCLENKLPVDSFFRTHRAYLVNIDNIEHIIPWFNYTYKLVMQDKDKTEVPVSRTYCKEFKKMLDL
ncbi:MAG: LytTR family DNA-binding domain-containing protein [Clostridiales bacterium]|nr:LytTR family DNA-binding domain-containing protein [Clostridiales bacterium]MCF8021269.1 LytTR family DNA-binding domain-containing protein [Clostridiales bacterium]